jgi:hypothetical protein
MSDTTANAPPPATPDATAPDTDVPAAMAFRILREARVQAMERAPRGVFVGGPVLGDDPESLRLRHTRGRRAVDSFRPDARYSTRLAGSHAYLGIASGHFGHAMAETIHRIVPTLAIEPNPSWVILGRRGGPEGFDRLPPICRTILALFGIDGRNTTVVTEDTIVERLLVVEAGADLGGAPKEWYLDRLATFTPALIAEAATRPTGGAAREPVVSERLYVSRSRLSEGSGLLGEAWLDAALEASGYTVFHPQEHALLDQMATYVAADVAVFAEGSACHGVELFGRGGLGHTVLLNRRQKRRSQFDHVLGPRSRRYSRFDGNRYLGSVLVEGKSPLVHLGVTLLDTEALARFMEEAGIGPLAAADRSGYLAAAEADLEAYIAAAPHKPQRFDPSLVAEVREAFRTAARGDGPVTVRPREPRRISS